MTKQLYSNGNRRRFLKWLGGSALVLPVLGLNACSKQEPTVPPSPTAAPPEPASTPSVAAAPPAADAPSAETPSTAAPPAAPPAAIGALPHLAETDPVAKALGYHQDASTVDATKYPQHLAGQACHKCVQFRGATDAWGPCNIFSANLVNANGWCTAFAAKA